MNTQEFLQTMYSGAASGFLTIWTLPDKRTAFFPVTEMANAVSYAESRFDTHDVYFGVGLRGAKLDAFQRGGNDDVSVVTAFWADVDVVNAEAHAESALPPSIDAALDFLDTLPLQPSIVVSSGNGLHVYWQFAEPLVIMTDAHRRNIAGALRGWQMFVNNAAKEYGWKLDNTSDLSRVLRIPGGVNHKTGDDRRAEVISVSEQCYTPQDFKVYIPNEETSSNISNTAERTDFNAEVGNADRILEKCAFMQYCRDNAATLTEPYWYAMTSNLSLAADGVTVCHEFSKPYPHYKQDETKRKIAHALAEKKPHTCAYIRNALCFDCGDCAAGCRAPISLAIITKADSVRELLAKDIEDYGMVFTDDYIDALAYSKAKSPGDYAQFKQKHKGKISVRDLENCIKDYGARQRKSGGAILSGELLNLDGIDLGGAVVPRKWQITDSGVRKFVESKNGTEEIIVCPDSVVITRRLVNIDDGKERLELSFRKDGCWKSVIGNRTQVYNKQSIIGFGDDGLHVTSGTAAELVSYLSDYETANKAVIPRVASIGRLGWLDDTQFFPYSTNEEILFEEDKGTAVLYKNLAERGDYAVWKEMMVTLRKNPIARFITSASFASPLLCKIGVRTFVIHLWHMSASGKSAALKAAISVWGNPLRIMGNGFTTIVGTEQLAGTLRNLPFGIDEKQSADERRLSLEQLIYVLGQGSGKIRGAKGGGNAEVATWHNVVMLTGEEPITRNSSLDGIQTRTFEIYGKPVDDVDFAKEAHIVSEQNYGFAGAEFMRHICAMLRIDVNCLKKLYNQTFSNEFKQRGLKNIHADYIAAVALGDYLAETLIFGTDSEVALRGAIAMGETIYQINESQISDDSTERAWDFVTGWLVGNEGRFTHDATPCYGKTQQSPGGNFAEFYVISQHLDTALEDAGFNVKKAFQGFREQGLIETYKDGNGKVRTKTRYRLGDTLVNGYVFRLKSEGIKPLVGKSVQDL
ncbi:hypothetical protein FACS1894217_08840 [Clostridia bacterium]|nr:hypothetical protein FACS1894217_08840 [Clostridia bacterium]